jgi:hypothetical protein
MQIRRRITLLVLGALACQATTATGTTAQGSQGADPLLTVSCSNIRVAPAEVTADGRRVVLGTVSVPPVHIGQVARYGHDGWAYVKKAPIFIEAGSPVVRIGVPKAWRKRVAIAWGLSGPVSAQRIGACAPPATYWSGYVGGFFLKEQSACVPLAIQVGQQSTTVRFGIGRRCTPSVKTQGKLATRRAELRSGTTHNSRLPVA